MDPARVDLLVDLAYGVLILVAVGAMVVFPTTVGVAFGLGVFLSYLVHVGWKMGRFDPDWMTRVETAVEETVSEQVETAVEEQVEQTVDEQVEASVERSVGDTLEEALERSVGETVEETLRETVERGLVEDESVPVDRPRRSTDDGTGGGSGGH